MTSSHEARFLPRTSGSQGFLAVQMHTLCHTCTIREFMAEQKRPPVLRLRLPPAGLPIPLPPLFPPSSLPHSSLHPTVVGPSRSLPPLRHLRCDSHDGLLYRRLHGRGNHPPHKSASLGAGPLGEHPTRPSVRADHIAKAKPSPLLLALLHGSGGGGIGPRRPERAGRGVGGGG